VSDVVEMHARRHERAIGDLAGPEAGFAEAYDRWFDRCGHLSWWRRNVVDYELEQVWHYWSIRLWPAAVMPALCCGLVEDRLAGALKLDSRDFFLPRSRGSGWRPRRSLILRNGFEEFLLDPESCEPFTLTDAERAFLKHAFELTADGRLKYPELVFSGPKKSGKTAFAAMMIIYVVRELGGSYAEGYCITNDYEQASGRVFQAASRIVEASPLLSLDAKITSEKITFISTGATITAMSRDYVSAAGANPTISVFDELWGYTSERSRRLFDEMVPPPTRALALRLTVTYAGYEGESVLLEDLYKRGIAGQQIASDLYVAGGLLMYWTNAFSAPWQTEEWREQMREQLRLNAYLRLIENRWVTTESTFIPTEWWDQCVDPEARPALAERERPVWLGVAITQGKAPGRRDYRLSAKARRTPRKQPRKHRAGRGTYETPRFHT
jgi:hypothetical protein